METWASRSVNIKRHNVLQIVQIWKAVLSLSGSKNSESLLFQDLPLSKRDSTWQKIQAHKYIQDRETISVFLVFSPKTSPQYSIEKAFFFFFHFLSFKYRFILSCLFSNIFSNLNAEKNALSQIIIIIR